MSTINHYKAYKAAGLCTCCNRAKASNGVRCSQCREKDLARGRRNRKRWREEGRCSRCGGERDGEQSLCASCRENIAKNQKKYRAKRNRAHRRRWDRLTPAEKSERKAREVIRHAERYRRLKAARLCVDCTLPAEGSYVRCVDCRRKKKEYRDRAAMAKFLRERRLGEMQNESA